MDRLGQHAVGREEEHEPDLVGDDAALDGRPSDDGRAQEQAGRGVQDDAPARSAGASRHPLVAPGPPGPQPETRRPRRRRAAHPTKAITPPVPATTSRSRSPVDRSKPGSGPATTRKANQRGHHHHRVADRRGGGDGEPALGVQDGGGHGARGVQQHLGHEPPDEEGDQLLLLVDHARRHAEREQLGDERGGDDADHGHPAQDDQGDAEHAAGDVLGASVIAARRAA